MLQSLLHPREISRGVAEILRPPRRVKPSTAAAAYVRNEKGPWLSEFTPYVVEPLDHLGGRQYQGVVFVGPQRTGKTFGLILAGIGYVITCAPGDMLVVQMSQETARDFSRTDLSRMINHSPEIAARLSSRPRDNNIFDKFFRSGISLKIGYPAATQLAGKTLQYVFMPDYDRPLNRDDVDGHGPMWDQAFKRIETYMSRGKCLAESSPGEDYIKPNWQPSTPHEAPPALGIMSLYNRGTRARWFWRCLHCREPFQAEPGSGLFGLPEFEELEQVVQKVDLMSFAEQHARVVHRSCGGLHEMSDRPQLNAAGRWLHEGEILMPDGTVDGERRRTPIASYWLGGVAAAYQRWDLLIHKYLQAVQTYARTGDEQPLKSTTSSDQAAAYLPRAIAKRRDTEQLMKRREEWPRDEVPPGVRFLTAAVDVQINRFVIQVHGWGEGLESWLIDRFVITASRRAEGSRNAAIDPASYVEDWDILIREVIKRSYPVHGLPDRKLGILLTLCDSGGRAGVTENAYKFWRKLKRLDLHRKFQLVQGVGQMNAPRVQLIWPDTRGRSDRHAGGRGDVPVYRLNTNVLKDGIAGDVAREVPGPGFVHFPMWVEQDYFGELTAETRTAKGWERPRGVRNEALDLHVYNRAACIVLKAEKIDWKKPPRWALPLDATHAEQPDVPGEELDKVAEAERQQQAKPQRRRRRNWTTDW